MSVHPNLFILGAPKCGTTSLARWLSEHHNVLFSPVKEPHYFNTDDRHRNFQSSAEYADLFRGAASHHKVFAEASVWYLSSKTAVKNILESARCSEIEHSPRFVVCLRNPVEMAHSLHQQNLYGLYEDLPDFEDAWNIQAARARGQHLPSSCRDPRHLQYSDACSLGAQVQRLLSQVDQRYVQFIFMEDIKQDPAAVYAGLLAFLELPPDDRTDFTAVNVAKAHKSRALGRLIKLGVRAKYRLGITQSFGLDRLNLKPSPRSELSPSFRAELVRHFSGDVQLLSRLTGRCLAHWGAN